MTTATATTYQLLDTGRLYPSPLNPRKHIDVKKLEELVASIERSGIRTPLLVRPAAGGRFEIGAGERRWRAATKLALDQVPAIVQAMDDVEFLELLNFENLNREDLHEIEEAEGFQRLLEMPGGKWDVPAIAQRIGKSPSHVYERLHLLKLVKPAREAFFSGAIVAGHATDIARLAPDDQLEALKYATGKHQGYRQEALAVRELRDVIQRYIVRDLSKAPFDTKDAQLVPVAGACGPCPKRAANNPDLFGALAKGDRCMDGTCFTDKTERWLDGIRAEARTTAAEIQGVAGGVKVIDINVDAYGRGGKGLSADKWQRAGVKTCDHFRLGVVVTASYGQDKVGDVVKVCVKPRECKVHNPRAAARSSSSSTRTSTASRGPAEPKVSLKERARRKVFDLIRDKIKTPLVKGDLELIVTDVLFCGDGTEIVKQAYGWKGDFFNRTSIQKRLADLSANDLSRLLVETVLARDLAYQYATPEVLNAFAERYGVDVDKVEKELKAEDATKAKETKDKAKKPAMPAKKKPAGKKGKKS